MREPANFCSCHLSRVLQTSGNLQFAAGLTIPGKNTKLALPTFVIEYQIGTSKIEIPRYKSAHKISSTPKNSIPTCKLCHRRMILDSHLVYTSMYSPYFIYSILFSLYNWFLVGLATLKFTLLKKNRLKNFISNLLLKFQMQFLIISEARVIPLPTFFPSHISHLQFSGISQNIQWHFNHKFKIW